MKALKHNSGDISKIAFIIILGCAIFVRVIALSVSDNFHGIAAGKVVEALRLIKNLSNFSAWIVPAHGPIHLYLIAFFLKVFGKPMVIPQLISLFMGIALFIPYYRWLRILFSAEVASLSLFIVAFFPLHIIYSVLSTAEATFLLFLFLGLFFYEKHRLKGRSADLIFSAIFISISSMCRFEGGLFIAILSIFLIKEWKKLTLFLGIASILPLLWMICNYIYSGNFLQFLYASDEIVRLEFNLLRAQGEKITFFKKILYWPMQIPVYFGWPVAILAVFGIIRYGLRDKNRQIVGLIIVLLAFFSYKTIQEELAFQPRYGISLGLLFIPFFSILFLKIIKKSNKAIQQLLVISLLLFITIRGSYIALFNLPQAPDWIKKAGLFLNQNVGDNDTVFISTEDDNVKEPIKLYANIDIEKFADYDPFCQHIELLTPAGRGKVKYIVIISDRGLKNWKEEFKIDKCKIYNIKK